MTRFANLEHCCCKGLSKRASLTWAHTHHGVSRDVAPHTIMIMILWKDSNMLVCIQAIESPGSKQGAGTRVGASSITWEQSSILKAVRLHRWTIALSSSSVQLGRRNSVIATIFSASVVKIPLFALSCGKPTVAPTEDSR